MLLNNVSKIGLVCGKSINDFTPLIELLNPKIIGLLAISGRYLIYIFFVDLMQCFKRYKNAYFIEL